MTGLSILKTDDLNVSDELSDFIYNRFDLWENKSVFEHLELYTVEMEDYCIKFEVAFHKEIAMFGVWLLRVPSAALNKVARMVFSNHSEVKKIVVSNTIEKFFGDVRKGNHFHIDLPETAEQLDNRLSSKGRYNIRREKRMIEEQFGSCRFCKYEALSSEATNAWNKYFELKKETYNAEYNLSITDYCDKYHVTDVYTLEVGGNFDTIAVILSCEQCTTVYLENMSYDIRQSKLSPGQVLYDWYLKSLVSDKKQKLYLMGGSYEYKKRYGSIEMCVYGGLIYRNVFLNVYHEMRMYMANIYHYIRDYLQKVTNS